MRATLVPHSLSKSAAIAGMKHWHVTASWLALPYYM